jgi:hypothetical protein
MPKRIRESLHELVRLNELPKVGSNISVSGQKG